MSSVARNAALTSLLTFSLAVIVAGSASAGCGCDHPPPDWAQVVPAFGSPNKLITIYAIDGELTIGEYYSVDFGHEKYESVKATMTSLLEVKVPRHLTPGPVALHVYGPGYDHTYPDVAFTALANPRKIKDREGVFKGRKYKAAVTADGTLLLPLSVKDVLDPMQFAFAFRNLPLTFDYDDVVIYNSDGVDLTLFSLDVGTVEHQWGDYYGWTVESDAGLESEIYEGISADSDDIAHSSDLFTYWRHEFHTYKDAHAKGGSHEVGMSGYHPDLTLHVDHDNLVIAIQGVVRDASSPHDASLAQPLQPGMVQVDLGWISLKREAPVDLTFVAPLIAHTDNDWAEELEEVLFQEEFEEELDEEED